MDVEELISGELTISEEGNRELNGFDLITQAPEKMDWLIEGLMPRTGIGALGGGSDLGKSALLRQLGIEIAAGDGNFLGFETKQKHSNAIIVCTEDDRTAVSFLLKRQCSTMNREKLRGLRFVFAYEGELIDELDKRLSNNKTDIIIIDCFSDAFGADLKDTQKIRTFLSPYQKLSDAHKCFILFLHHTAKRTENLEPSKNNLLAGQGFEAKMRLVMELRADPYNSAFRHLCIVKGNYLPASMKKESFVLKFSEENFSFTNTGERTPFECLVKQAEDGSKDKYHQAKTLKEKGYTYEKIAGEIGYSSRGSVTKLFEKAEKNGW